MRFAQIPLQCKDIAHRIPYTSHNSSACLLVRAPRDRLDELAGVQQESVPGSDAGLCIVPQLAAGPAVQEFGQLAKSRVLSQASALDLARQHGLVLEGLSGDGGGAIGALAAVSLRAGQNDGRFIWLAGLRELGGVQSVEELYQTTRIDEICSLDGAGVPASARVDVDVWPRPILGEGRAVLLVERAADTDRCEWRVAPKEVIKRF